MPKSTVAGHPLHPMLIVMPAALIPFSFVLDALHQSTGEESYSNAAYYSLVGGVAGGLAAGVAGAMDYMTIERDTDVKRTANVHAAINIGALALTAANLLARRKTPDHKGGSILLSAAATAGIILSSWFGARMVYEQGMRVQGVDPIGHAADIHPPGDHLISEAMHTMEQPVPSSGPVLH